MELRLTGSVVRWFVRELDKYNPPLGLILAEKQIIMTDGIQKIRWRKSDGIKQKACKRHERYITS